MDIYIEEIQNALAVLKRGGVILCPTDTIWGLSCDAKQELAIQKIFEIKKRPSNSKLLILVSSLQQLKEYIHDIPSELEEELLQSDRPLTVIYPTGRNLPSMLLNEEGGLAVRIVKDGYAHMLINQMEGPIVSTSANLAGSGSPKNADDVSFEIVRRVDYSVDPHIEKHQKMTGQPSRILRLDAGGEFVTVRS